jgi:tRNA modification GTPase
MDTATDTIAAIATPPGKGGVGIIRVSGPQVINIAKAILSPSIQLKERAALFSKFYNAEQELLDEGLAIYFKNPNSFTGEDVLELQGHGGPVILDCLLKRVIELGARLARPGEFSERAFLNDKMDLAQAEAVADLIDASSQQAAKSAVKSLCGEFSKKIQSLVEQLIHLRMYVEAAIDFPEEEIDFLSDGKVSSALDEINQELTQVKDSAKQGSLLREGMTVVITGKPNVGKSSLLNALSGEESAIVTQIAGTTRDVLKEKITIDGMPLHVIDTAGIRESDDLVEQEGINRAKKAVQEADEILFLTEASNHNLEKELAEHFKNLDCDLDRITVIKNKIDLTTEKAREEQQDQHAVIYLSAKQQQGIEILKQHLKQKIGFKENAEGVFIARRRHLTALEQAEQFLKNGTQQLQEHKAGELLAEDLRQAQQALSEITGEFTSDDLLGRIFSSFCIGK